MYVCDLPQWFHVFFFASRSCFKHKYIFRHIHMFIHMYINIHTCMYIYTCSMCVCVCVWERMGGEERGVVVGGSVSGWAGEYVLVCVCVCVLCCVFVLVAVCVVCVC